MVLTEIRNVHFLRYEIEHGFELRRLSVLVNRLLGLEQPHVLPVFFGEFLDLLQYFFDLLRLQQLAFRVLLNLDGILLKLRTELIYHMHVIIEGKIVS